jgi:hypothetical protein
VGKKQQGAKYKYLRLPPATPEEAAARRKHLIKVGTIVPVSEQYACGHDARVDSPYCPGCGQTEVVWRATGGNL